MSSSSRFSASTLAFSKYCGLLLESVGERLLERDAVDQKRLSHGAAHDLLDANHPRVQQILVQVHHRVDAHLPEEVLLAADELRGQRGHGALLQQLALVLRVFALDGHGEFLHPAMAICAASRKYLIMFCGCTPSSTKGLHSRRNSPARMTTVVVPSPTSLSCVAGVHQRLCRRVNDVEKFHDGGSVVGDGGDAPVVVHELIQSAGALDWSRGAGRRDRGQR